MKPTQPLPWEVVEHADGEVVVVDANGFWVADFGPVRAEADFVVECVNKTMKRKRVRR